MKKIKVYCIITVIILMSCNLIGCSGGANEAGGKSVFGGKYEFFTDEDMELFRMSELSLTINGNTYTLGMSKDEIEDMLGEKGEGFAHSSSYGPDSYSDGDRVIEPDSYENYQTVNNYYYYPNSGIAVIYRSVQDGKETNNPAVSISVNNSSLVDSEGFSPRIDMMDDVKKYAKDNYGDIVKEDIDGGKVKFYYNEFGEQVRGRGWVSGDNRPGGWKAYYANDGKEIDAITVGSRKAFAGDNKLLDFWE